MSHIQIIIEKLHKSKTAKTKIKELYHISDKNNYGFKLC